MTAFDLERRCLVVRIVYDGPAFAGKTTNLRQLCVLFPVERRSEMFTPGSLKGRTMFFDWLEIDGGRKGKNAYRFQLLTVPGQVQRNYRRRPLLSMADAVVFVCDCSPENMPETKKSYAQLKSHLRARLPQVVPLVVQANKQDAPGALSPQEIARVLKLPEGVPVLSATASKGIGIRETVLAAVRSVVKVVEQQLAEHDVGAFADSPDTADSLFMKMLELEDAHDEEAESPAEPPAEPAEGEEGAEGEGGGEEAGEAQARE